MPYRTTGVWVAWNKYKDAVPSNSVRNNYEDQDKYYVIRAYHKGELVPGKYAINEKKAYISYGRKEHTKEHFEVNHYLSFNSSLRQPLYFLIIKKMFAYRFLLTQTILGQMTKMTSYQ